MIVKLQIRLEQLSQYDVPQGQPASHRNAVIHHKQTLYHAGKYFQPLTNEIRNLHEKLSGTILATSHCRVYPYEKMSLNLERQRAYVMHTE